MTESRAVRLGVFGRPGSGSDLRYPVKDGPYSSHSRIVRLVGDGGGLRLLDVGCAQGALAAEFQARDWVVTGIEPDPVDAAAARNRGLNILSGTLEELVCDLDQKFDVIVLADVLEHMPRPDIALLHIREMLAAGGRVVASIPNIAHLAVRLQLLVGKFDYTERGPLDRTHLRFYTKKTVLQLFHDAGYEVRYRGVTPAPLEAVMQDAEIPHAVHGVNQAIANAWNGGLGYQFLLVAVPHEC